MKQVLDPEIPLSLFRIDAEAKRAIQPKAMPPVLSPFDENALEAALKIKDIHETTITVISLGKELNRDILITALAAGADRLVLLQDEAFGEFSTCLTATAIAAAIRKLGQYHLILCGLQAADTNTGQVGIGIASLLGIPCITAAQKVELEYDRVRVEKVLPEGYEVIEANTPVVVTTTYKAGAMREPGVEAFISATKKPVTTWNARDLGIETGNTSRFSMISMYSPTRESKCEILGGFSSEEKAVNLLTRLKEVKVI